MIAHSFSQTLPLVGVLVISTVVEGMRRSDLRVVGVLGMLAVAELVGMVGNLSISIALEMVQ